jgi:hypothetical protein
MYSSLICMHHIYLSTRFGSRESILADMIPSPSQSSPAQKLSYGTLALALWQAGTNWMIQMKRCGRSPRWRRNLHSQKEKVDRHADLVLDLVTDSRGMQRR